MLERNTRNKKKCITTISGLDLFGVKLSEASKMFGKKFASGASITKNAEGKEQIDCQVSRGGEGTRERPALGRHAGPVPGLLVVRFGAPKALLCCAVLSHTTRTASSPSLIC